MSLVRFDSSIVTVKPPLLLLVKLSVIASLIVATTATTIRTLTRRAHLVCDSPDSLQDKTDFLNNLFSKNNLNLDDHTHPTYEMTPGFKPFTKVGPCIYYTVYFT